jgi:hypothetical protein
MKSVVVLNMVARLALVTYRMGQMLGQLRLSSRSPLASRPLPVLLLPLGGKIAVGK